MIKSNLICTTKLSNGSTTIDLTKLTEDYKIENMKKCKTLVCCDKISNGQEVFDLSELGKGNGNNTGGLQFSVRCRVSTDETTSVEKMEFPVLSLEKQEHFGRVLTDKINGMSTDGNKYYILILVAFSTKMTWTYYYIGKVNVFNCPDDDFSGVDGLLCSGWVELPNANQYDDITLSDLYLHQYQHVVHFDTDSATATLDNEIVCVKHKEEKGYSPRLIVDTMKMKLDETTTVSFKFKRIDRDEWTTRQVDLRVDTTGALVWFEWNEDTKKYNLHFMYIQYDEDRPTTIDVVCDNIYNKVNGMGIGYTLYAYAEIPDGSFVIPAGNVSFYNGNGDFLSTVYDSYFSIELPTQNEYDFLLETPFLTI